MKIPVKCTILILCLTSLSTCASNYIRGGELLVTGHNDSGSDYYVTVNNLVRLLCVGAGDVNSRCYQQDMMLSYNKDTFKLVNKTRMNETAFEFYMMTINSSTEEHKSIQCLCQFGSGKSHVALRYFMIGFPPKDVDDFECRLENYVQLSCTWDLQATRKVSWSVCYTIRIVGGSNRQITARCDFLKIHKTSSLARIVHNGILLHFNYRFYINASNDFGFYSKEIGINASHDIVIIDPPSVNIVETGSRQINLLWVLNCSTVFDLRYSCRYCGVEWLVNAAVIRSSTSDYDKIRSNDLMIRKDGAVKSPLDFDVSRETVSIPDLLPFTDYTLSMQIRINGSHVWSDPTIIHFKTSAAAPSKGAEIPPDGFSVERNAKECSYPKMRISVYWKNTTIHSGANGPITSYETVPWGVDTSGKGRARQAMFCADEDKTVNVTVFARNEAGRGRTGASITIPSKKLEVEACLVQARTLRDTNKVNVSWININRPGLLNSTAKVFWCKQEGGKCQEILVWRLFNFSAKSSVIELERSPLEYKFGVGITDDDGLMSGILWSKCLYGHDIPDPRKVLRLTTNIENGTNIMRVSVDTLCVRGAGPIAGAVYINVCRIGMNRRCEPKSENKTQIIISDFCTKVLDTDLGNASSSFKVWLSIQNHSLVYHPTIVDHLLPEKNREDLMAVIIIAAAVPIIIVLIVGITLLYYWNSKDKLASFRQIKVIDPPRDLDIEVDTNSLTSDITSGNTYYYPQPISSKQDRAYVGGDYVPVPSNESDPPSSIVGESTIDSLNSMIPNVTGNDDDGFINSETDITPSATIPETDVYVRNDQTIYPTEVDQLSPYIQLDTYRYPSSHEGSTQSLHTIQSVSSSSFDFTEQLDSTMDCVTGCTGKLPDDYIRVNQIYETNV